MKDLFGNEIIEEPVEVNIYADEVISKECPDTQNKWHYIGLIVENLRYPLLRDIIGERYCNNFDKSSPYYEKNNKRIHWVDISSIDEMNICQRWFKYIMCPDRSEKTFYCYILGLNDSFLNKDEFDPDNEFNSKYNRFFRSAIKYALRRFFGDSKIIIRNVYHEQGQQQDHLYFPWHCIYKLEREESNFTFEKKEIEFLQRDHTKDERANLIQLCDCFLGAVTSIIHGINKESKRSKYRKELMNILLPLISEIVNNPEDKNSNYKYFNRIIIRFFPRERTTLDNPERYTNQFYTKRRLKYVDDLLGQSEFKF